jgi:hypothetical protein
MREGKGFSFICKLITSCFCSVKLAKIFKRLVPNQCLRMAEKLEKLTIVWEKPFKFSEKIPPNLRGAVGLYLLEKDSRVLYIGKAEDQGGFKRAKDHLRGQMDHTGICLIQETNAKDKNEISIWAGWLEQGENPVLIDSAERLLTWKLNPPCNRTNRRKYPNQSLVLINSGDKPDFLPSEISSHAQG